VNEGMISQMNLKKEIDKVDNVKIVQGSLLDNMDEIKEYKNKFDLITCNFVVHHLDTDFSRYPNLRLALE
jgi:2-polyprenyl-3-methyl-5-hydroxy-6-metoxy-1,4-benzoquinol methylase